jgi:hypothetical protein
MGKKPFDISAIDLSKPASVKKLKEHVVREAYSKAMEGEKDAVNALSSFISIVVEAERQFNVVREEKLLELEQTINELEETLDHIITKKEIQTSETVIPFDDED